MTSNKTPTEALIISQYRIIQTEIQIIFVQLLLTVKFFNLKIVKTLVFRAKRAGIRISFACSVSAKILELLFSLGLKIG